MIHDKGHKGVSKVTFWVQKKTATAAATTTTLLEQRLLPPLDCNEDDRRRPISRFSFEVPQQNTVVFWATGTRLPGGHKKEFHIKNTYYPFMALVLCLYDIWAAVPMMDRWHTLFWPFLPISTEFHLMKNNQLSNELFLERRRFLLFL